MTLQKRTDKYGGSFENRTRLLVDIIQAIRAVMPETMPLLVRISATEWMEWSGQESWDVPQSVRLAKLLPALGVDLLDVSSGGNNAEQKIELHTYYQIDIAGHIRQALGTSSPMKIGAVGMVTTAEIARDVVEEAEIDDGTVEMVESTTKQKTKADLVLAARQFLREPEFVLRVAHQLGVDVKWPVQYSRAQWPAKGAKLTSIP